MSCNIFKLYKQASEHVLFTFIYTHTDTHIYIYTHSEHWFILLINKLNF